MVAELSDSLMIRQGRPAAVCLLRESGPNSKATVAPNRNPGERTATPLYDDVLIIVALGTHKFPKLTRWINIELPLTTCAVPQWRGAGTLRCLQGAVRQNGFDRERQSNRKE
jgi:hypothetical protein